MNLSESRLSNTPTSCAHGPGDRSPNCGGCAGDRTKSPDWDPVGQAPKPSGFWSGVTAHTGAPYPVNLKWVSAGSEASGIGLCAARLQGETLELAVLRRMREAIFVFGQPPDTLERVLDAVRDTPGLDMERFERDLTGAVTLDAYRTDWEETRKPNDFVRHLKGNWPGIGNLKQTDGYDRYAFPTVLFRGPGGEQTVSGWCPYEAYIEAMEKAVPGSTANPRPDPTASEAFDRWPLLTSVELETLCGPGTELPANVQSYNWGHGEFYYRPEVYPAILSPG